MSGATSSTVDQDRPEQRIVFPVLLACMLTMIFLQAFTDVEWITRIFYIVVIIGPVIQVRKNRWMLIAGIVIVGTATASSIWDLNQYENGILSITASLSLLAAFIFTALVTLQRVLSHRKVTTATVSGALCVFLLMGIIWALSYLILERDIESSNRPFNGIDKAQTYRDAAAHLIANGTIERSEGFDQDLETFIVLDTVNENARHSDLPQRTKALIRREAYDDISSKLFYFSYVTLTTLGYGDISPRSEKARSLTMLEAICGQMFLAVLIARLVGLHIAMASSTSKPPE